MDRREENADRLSYTVGTELKLRDILSRTDLLPLFQALLAAGAAGVSVSDDQDAVIQSSGINAESCRDEAAVREMRRDIVFEGETVGSLSCCFSSVEDEVRLPRLIAVAMAALQLIVNATVKRMLATELHTTVVHQSYEELLETNRRLAASEKLYRELAESLELKVEERTSALQKALARMLQQEKLASTGQLAAGLAHEINNPLGFILSNLNTFESYVKRINEMMLFCRDLAVNAGSEGRKAEDLFRKLRIDFILEDAPGLIKQSRSGAERIRTIVSNLKGFSHVDDAQKDYVEINDELDRTIGVLEHESRGKATFIRHYGILPKYLCRPGLICQVFLNIIQNAIQASNIPVQIMITTQAEGGAISIRIEDDGPGMQSETIGRIFEPFFTTKEVGKGTGLGLSVAYDIVREHGGDISVSSMPGEGAAFTITLPTKEQPDV